MGRQGRNPAEVRERAVTSIAAKAGCSRESLWARDRNGKLMHNGARGSQERASRYSERPAEEGNELFKTDVIRPQGLWRGLDTVADSSN